MIYRLTNLEFLLPRIVSEVPLIHFVKSCSFTDAVYRVDLASYTCTCPNWIESRGQFSIEDLRRACKHISSFMKFFPLGWILPLPADQCRHTYLMIDGYQHSLVNAQNTEWINVKVQNRVGGIFEYGYNLDEKRWSYATKPKYSKYLRPLIVKWSTSTDPNDWFVEQ
jgi:hypothetical protein